MRRLIDDTHGALVVILEELLAKDIDITVREVARRHPSLHDASAFTRNPARSELIQAAQRRQKDARGVVVQPHLDKALSMAEQLRKKDEDLAQLDKQLRALVASHVGCIHAVMLAGGINALERFWDRYKAVGAAVSSSGAMPSDAQVVPLRSKQVKATK